jgi:hypothetical protein
MINLSLSSDEENFIADTSHHAEFARKLFGDLNRDILGLPGDGNIIVLDDSDEEEEAQKEKTVGTEPTSTSTAINPASTTSVDDNEALAGMKNDNNDDQGPDQEASGGNDNRGVVGEP